MVSFSQTNYEKLIDEGLELLKQRNIPAALIKYEQAYKLDSTRVEANYGLGTAYQFQCEEQGKNCSLALKFLDNAIKIEGSYRNSYYNRGCVKNKLGNYKSAIIDFNKAIAKDPNKSHFYINRAFAFQKLGDTANMCNDLKKAAELNSPVAKQFLIDFGCH